MKRLAKLSLRHVAFAAAIGLNLAAATTPARAAEDLNVDRLGGLIVVWCDGCWFWNCNC